MVSTKSLNGREERPCSTPNWPPLSAWPTAAASARRRKSSTLVHGGDEAAQRPGAAPGAEAAGAHKAGTVLTPAGEVIYRYARQMFADSDRALREARAAAQAARSAFVWEPPSSIPAGPLWTCGTASAGTSPATSSTSSPMRTTTRGFWERSALGEKFDFLIGACDSRQWLDRCNFLPLGSIATASPSPGDTLAGRKGSPWQSCMGRP